MFRLSPYEAVVRLGVFNLTDGNESGAIQRNVSEIFTHPEWDVYDDTYDADIAILILSENITFTDDIQPACVPGDGIIENIDGMVVGWGLTENSYFSEIPRQASVKAINDSHCLRADNAVAALTSSRTFCGGYGDGSPNRGDSGGGFFAISGSAWVLYGIVSVILTNATGHVVPNSFTIYTNLTAFKNWTIETVTQSGGVVGEPIVNIKMNCVYGWSESASLYGCWLYDIDIQSYNIELASLSGSHLHDKTQHDVELIQFVNGTMFFLPNVGIFFENIKSIFVGVDDSISLGVKHIRRTHLRNLKNLLAFSIYRNDIERLVEDTLWDLSQLQVFRLVNNKLKSLSEGTFNKNEKLKEIYLNSNQLTHLPERIFQNNLLLEIVDFRQNLLTTIDEKIFDANSKLIGVSFVSNQLVSLPKKLFKNVTSLELVDFKNNSLASIDEDLFQTNVNLTAVSLSSNQLKSLPRNLFRNNWLLDIVDFRNNFLTLIDEKLFERNGKLKSISFASNQLELVQRNLFENNVLLEWMDFFNNSLHVIEIDFTAFKNVKHINLNMNDCINTTHMQYDPSPTTNAKNIKNLTEFQDLVKSNCTNVSDRS